ncbi:MAG TPA: HD domain-containing phosphohydrolase [Actinomycetota bacterium]|nr:HD domain-containing phosphohydrolase [Actinomycetota bacterium]
MLGGQDMVAGGSGELLRLYQREKSRADALEGAVRVGVMALAGAIAARDAATGEHSGRVVRLATAVLQRLDWREAGRVSTEFGFVLHDVGKLGIPDAILLKPGPLTAAERSVMRQHPVLGVQVLERIPVFQEERITRIVRHHHERWDGRGYPDRLGGRDIPVACRAFAVVDAFDAMTSDRPYRTAVPAEEAIAEIHANSATQFDPEAVAALEDVLATTSLGGPPGEADAAWPSAASLT